MSNDRLHTVVKDDVFRAVFDSSSRPLLLMAADPPRFTMVAVNAAHAKAFSTTREALEGRGVFEVFPAKPEPHVARFMEAIRASLMRVMDSGGTDQMPIGRLTGPSLKGDLVDRYWTATHTPICGADGAITHIVSATQDVTGEVHERRSEAARELLMREVDHRARNTLTVVQSLVRLSRAQTLDEFRSGLEGRIGSLARAQTSLAARKWEGALLTDIVEGALAGIAPDRLTVEGPRLVLAPDDVQAVSMILHELATNAMKYGSLAQPGGALAITWSRDEAQMVRIVWREETSTPIAPPQSSGFGSRLIAQLVDQLNGRIDYEWSANGLVAAIEFRRGRRTG